MEIIIQFALVAVGFFLLVKGADIFVDGASSIAVKMGIPMLVVGLTIVAMGTSLPEAAVSISAALKDSAEIAVGNVLGSNILNVLLILGLSAIIAPLLVQKITMRYEIPFTIAITIIFALLGLTDGKISFTDGLILWGLFIIYFIYLFWVSKTGSAPVEDVPCAAEKSILQLVLMIVLGGTLIIFGSNITVNAAKEIASFFGMSERLIGLTIVALGTSLPELVTSTIAASKGNVDIAVGNIIGSNIFNILFVIGTSALITPVIYAPAFLADSIIAILSCVLLLVLLFNKKRQLNRTGGIIMLIAFVAYMIHLI